MAAPFNIIGIYGRVKNAGVAETLKALVHYYNNTTTTSF